MPHSTRCLVIFSIICGACWATHDDTNEQSFEANGRAEPSVFHALQNGSRRQLAHERGTDSSQHANSFFVEKKHEKETDRFPSQEYVNPYFVKKTIFNQKRRVMFIAGLEGSGHHIFNHFMDACNTPKVKQQLGVRARFCSFDKEVQSLFYRNKATPYGIFIYGSPNEDIPHDQNALKRELAQWNNDKPLNIFILNIGRSWDSGQQSYANFGGVDKPLHHPDLQILAQICENAKVDLRVLVLQRGAFDILKSTINRNFGDVNHQAAVLADNAAVLSMQLQLIDPKFFFCTKFETLLAVKGWPKDMKEFLHPQLLKSDIVIEFHKMKMSNNSETSTDSTTMPVIPGEVHTNHVAVAISFLDDICAVNSRQRRQHFSQR